MRVDSGIYLKFFHPIAKEFQREKLSLKHQPVDDFLICQWQKHTKAFWWLFYRWGLAICFCIGVIGSLVEQFQAGKWFIYLTDWGFFLCMLTSIIGAILVSTYHLKPQYFEDTASATDLYNLWAHGFNTILMIVDHMLVAFPTRLLHFVYPFCLLLVYGLFTIIYFFSGGVDPFGNRYVYPILNWSEPGWAMLTVIGCIVLVMLWCFILFGLYKLRCFIYRKTKHTMLTFKA